MTAPSQVWSGARMAGRVLVGVVILLVVVFLLSGCGASDFTPAKYDLCPGSTCHTEGLCVDLAPGTATCRSGVWVLAYDEGEGCSPARCTASRPVTWCTWDAVACAPGVTP